MKAITEILSTINVTNWCSQNYLDLSVTKTDDMIFDFRRIQNVNAPIGINYTAIDLAMPYKYLGCTIQDNLKWEIHVEQQQKKVPKRMYMSDF